MFATLVLDLLRVFRNEVDDVINDDDWADDTDQLWKNDEILAYMTEAFDAVCRGTNVWTSMVTVQLTEGEPTVTLPARVLHIYSARLGSTNSMLREEGTEIGAYYNYDDYGFCTTASPLFASGQGRPKVYVREYDTAARPATARLRIVPTPNADDTLILQVSRTLDCVLDINAGLPFNDAPELRLVLLYMKSLAYRKHDAETEDLVRARDARAQFDAMIRDREVALRNYRRPAGAVRMDW